MNAQIRLSLTAEQTTRLDAMRGPATRTAYAGHLLAQALAAGRQEQDTASDRPAGKGRAAKEAPK